MEIFPPTSNSTSGFFISSKSSPKEAINGFNFKPLDATPNLENLKEGLVPKFSNGFFKPDIFMEPKQEKKKRGRPRKVDPNLSLSDSSSNISSIPPSPQSSFPQNSSNIDLNALISGSGSQYSPYTNTNSETYDELTLPSDETYEEMFKMINSACQEAKIYYKETRGIVDLSEMMHDKEGNTERRRKSTSSSQMATPHLMSPTEFLVQASPRRKSTSASKNLMSPVPQEKQPRRKFVFPLEPKLTEAQKKKILTEKIDKYKYNRPLITKVPQLQSLTSYQLNCYMRKVRNRPQVHKHLPQEISEFIFEEPCLASPGTSKDHDLQHLDRLEDDDPDELTDMSSEAETEASEVEEQENMDFYKERAKVIAMDIKVMRRMQEIEAQLAKKQRELLHRFPDLKIEDSPNTHPETPQDPAPDSSETCARSRPVPSIYRNRSRPQLIRPDSIKIDEFSQNSNLIKARKIWDDYLTEYLWNESHLEKSVVKLRRDTLEDIGYLEKNDKLFEHLFKLTDGSKKSPKKKKKPSTPITSPIKDQKTKKPQELHKKLLKKSLDRKRKVNKPSKPASFKRPERKSSEDRIIDFYSPHWRLSHSVSSANPRKNSDAATSNNEVHDALAKLAKEAQYAEIFTPTWHDIDLLENLTLDDCSFCHSTTEEAQWLDQIDKEHKELEQKERHWHTIATQPTRLSDRRKSEMADSNRVEGNAKPGRH